MRSRLVSSICAVVLLSACSGSGVNSLAVDSADEAGGVSDGEAGTTVGETSDTAADGDTTTGGDGDGPICGNMVVEAGEACDDGNTVETDECTNACLFAECGDGHIQAGVEDCDDGNDDPFDECTNDCTVAGCGDGIVQAGEECDAGEGNNGPGMACKGDCTNNVCGDGDPGPGEGCDDGNLIDDDVCNNMCAPSTCGDAMMQAPEECDDGNAVNEDMCTNVCTSPACGDAFVQAGEECDEGPSNSNNAMCTFDCLSAACGDGHVWAGVEECDDGVNNGMGMACNDMCLENYCGDGDIGPGEQCDDGNQTSGDGCSSVCVPEMALPEMPIWCGDAVYECGDTLDNDNDGLPDLEDPECTSPCDDDESSFLTNLPGQNEDCKQDCFFDANSGQGDDKCLWNLECDPENPGADVGCEYDPNSNQCEVDPQLPQACLNFCIPLLPNGCDCFGCCEIAGEYYYLDSNSQCSMDNLDACNNCTYFPECWNECEPENCELCFGQGIDDLPPECTEPSCDFGSPCEDESDCPGGQFCQTGCCTPVTPG